MFDLLKLLIWSIEEAITYRKQYTQKDYELNRIESNIIRNVHSIEKGLSIESPKTGFGIKKINSLLELLKRYDEMGGGEEINYYVMDSLDAYLEFHKKIGFDSKDIQAIKSVVNELRDKYGTSNECHGGAISLFRNDLHVDEDVIEQFFNTRHSIRSFTGAHVPDDLVMKAVKLAQRAPSACNRQAVRVYSINANDYINNTKNLEGIGGFAQDVDKFLLITGKTSSYRRDERNQAIVSASIYAGYLSLTLHAYGIGGCVVQRSLFRNKEFDGFRGKYNIPEDEQLVVMIGIGMPKETFKVPVSKRFDISKIYRNLSENK